QINHDAPVFGLSRQSTYVALAATAVSADGADSVRRSIASAVHVPADRVLSAQVGAALGFIVPRAPESCGDRLVAVGPPLPLDQLAYGYEEAVLTLETGRRFAMTGVLRLADVGPRPLVLCDSRTADGLSA
ncbi:PucR family transcriptional regulator, partial [Streptomyces sp. SID11233]|nr:PucR family transcriptional regulator [Streptomyces sp. SID11233]